MAAEFYIVTLACDDMDRLSSCYFCGAALDAQLSEYPVVPRRLQPEGAGSKTVVLCDGCRRKLGNVLEEVVAAAEGDSTDAPDYAGTDFEPIGAATNGEAPADRSAVGEASDGTGRQPERIDTVSTADEATSSSDSGPARSSETSGATADTGNDGAGDGSDGPSLTKLEYNKVMRLLQNREFPVDRLEIREVATSAYRIDPEEFDAVIDAAIERGLIAEEDGQFVEAEGR